MYNLVKQREDSPTVDRDKRVKRWIFLKKNWNEILETFQTMFPVVYENDNIP